MAESQYIVSYFEKLACAEFYYQEDEYTYNLQERISSTEDRHLLKSTGHSNHSTLLIVSDIKGFERGARVWLL